MLDLFSGIGGFALAAQWVWGEDLEIVSFCEIDKFCQKVLKKHWPDVPCHDDIKTLECEQYAGTIDLLTGGFPCQDISISGPGTGLSGERSGLWKHLRRIVEQVRPSICVFENSPMLKSRGYDEIKMEMDRMCYRTRPFVADSCLYGTNQRRIRVFVVAYSVCNGNKRHWESGNIGENGQGRESGQAYLPAADWRTRPILDGSPEPMLCRRDARIPNRVDRLRAIGNAIVPQVAQVIFQAIKEIENDALPSLP